MSIREIRQGKARDHCNTLTDLVLKRAKKENDIVTWEVSVERIPENLPFGILLGVKDICKILEGLNVCIRSLPDGSVFYEREPLITIKGSAKEIINVKSAVTGTICFFTTIATRAYNLLVAAKGKPVTFFGLRKVHPSHLLQYLRAAFLSGLEVAITPAIKDFYKAKLFDCQEHTANIIIGNLNEGWSKFLKLPKSTGRLYIVLDNFSDPVCELKTALHLFGDKLECVLIDTHYSRRGNIRKILKELRWYIDMNNKHNFCLALSGGVTPDVIKDTHDLVNMYGVGTWILNGNIMDISIQPVCVNGESRSKIGYTPGEKSIFLCSKCGKREVRLLNKINRSCSCGSKEITELYETFMINGQIIKIYDDQEIRQRILQKTQSKNVSF